MSYLKFINFWFLELSNKDTIRTWNELSVKIDKM